MTNREILVALRLNLSAIWGIVKYGLATAFLALAPLAARADEVTFRGILEVSYA